MGSEIAVSGSQHVKQVTSTRAERFSHAEIVFKDLARRCGHVRGAVEEMLDDVVCE